MSIYPYPIKQEPLVFLGTLADRCEVIQMSHTYRGLMITAEISLLKLYSNRAVFRGLCSQIGVKPGDQILLHSPFSDRILMGRILESNHHQCLLSVGNLNELEHPWAERTHERVQAQEPVRVMLRSGASGVSAFLENLSLGGAGLLAYKPSERGLEPKPGQAVKLEFKLPRGGGQFSLPGRVANLGQPSATLACLGIATYPTVEQARQIERYVSNRKSEILSEITASFTRAFEYHPVTNLYF